jgi:acetyl esterase/lipase
MRSIGLACRASVAAALFLFAQVAAGLAYANPPDDVAESEIRNARPGGIIRIWPLEGGSQLGAKAYRVLYRSTGLHNEPISVTAAIIFPEDPAPAGGRPVVAWAHPTSGIATRCAPTLLPGVQVQGIDEMLRRGYVIVATDYPGLGTEGIHPYLIGTSEAYAVLDSVRAARELPDAKAQKRFAVWGHSQGGHAALFTGQLAASYAPELELVGVAAAAPATYLVDLFDADRHTQTGLTITSMALLSWSKLYDLSTRGIVDPGAMAAYEKVANDCLENLPQMLRLAQDAKPLMRTFLETDPSRIPAWRAIMDLNTPGQAPAGAPVFIAQGTADTTVPPRITRRFAEHLCKEGVALTYRSFGSSHIYIARDSSLAAVTWMAHRFAGQPAASNCPR